MSQLWYIREGGREMGPMGFLLLRILVEEGKISPATLVRPEGQAWRPANQVEELFSGQPAGEAGLPEGQKWPANPEKALETGNRSTRGGGQEAGWALSVGIFVILFCLRAMLSVLSSSSSSTPSSPPPTPLPFHVRNEFAPRRPPAIQIPPIEDLLRDPNLDPEVRRHLDEMKKRPVFDDDLKIPPEKGREARIRELFPEAEEKPRQKGQKNAKKRPLLRDDLELLPAIEDDELPRIERK